jgi:subtilisin family serine protease
MRNYLILILACGALAKAVGADAPLGRLPDGGYYLKDEVDFKLKEEVARELSPANGNRRAVAKGRLLGMHGAIRDVVAGHSAAQRWLDGQELPERVRGQGAQVPNIARSLKAKLRDGADAAQVVVELQQHPDVEWASVNRVRRPAFTPNDARFDEQWGPQRIRAEDAWDVSLTSTSRRVAIIDTGVDLVHPDLSSRIVYNRGFGGNSNGDAKRDRRGGSSIDHGTHVAGTAAAIRNNSIGVAGVTVANIMAMGCSSWNADANQYWICCAADAINDAVANNADAINCSFGNDSLASSESDALDNAQDNGCLVVVAAGNDGSDVDTSDNRGWNDHGWPLIVSNVRSDDTLSGSSNFGPAIDLGAPGSSILSTVTTNYMAANANGTYGNMSGTSMASPHVAGAAVMVRGMNPNLISGSGIKSLLYRMAEDLGAAGKDNSYGNGMLQLDPAFLRPLRDAEAFVNSAFPAVIVNNGHYNLPYTNIPDALGAIPDFGTLVLNGGSTLPSSITYPPITISKPCTLAAFPDRTVIIGQ